MKELITTNGFIVKLDDEDYERFKGVTWYASKGVAGGYYARRIDTPTGQRILRLLHRCVMNVTSKDLVVDHINHDTLDNRKENLRVCTQAENRLNRRSAKGSSSKYLGVSKATMKRGQKVYTYWKAEIRTPSKYMYLGIFKNEVDAAMKYNEAAKLHYGDYANLNITPK